MTLPAEPAWPTKSLAELGAKVTSGSRGWASRYADHGSLFVRITNLNRENIRLDLKDSRFVDVEPEATDAQRTRLAVGDLLISITADVGIIGYVDDQVPSPAYINQHIARVRLDPGLANGRFVAYYLASWQPQRRFTGSTDMGAKAGINLKTVAALETVVPSVREQLRIAETLANVDDLIEISERVIAKKQAIKQGMMQQLLFGRTRLPGFAGGWTATRVGDFAQVTSGGTPSTEVRRYWGGDIRWMSSGEIHAKRVHEVAGRITAAGLRESAAHLLPVSSVLIAIAGQGRTRGTVAITHVDLATNQSIAGILPCGQHDPEFLYYFLDARYEELRNASSGQGGRGGLNLTILRNVAVTAPPLEEQQAISRVLAEADREIEVLKRRLGKTRHIRQGILQELLTGRTRLQVDEPAA